MSEPDRALDGLIASTLRIAQDETLPVHERAGAMDDLREWASVDFEGFDSLATLDPPLRSRLDAFLAAPPLELTRTRTPRHPRGRPTSTLDDAHTARVAAFLLACRHGASVEAAREATTTALGVSDRSLDTWVGQHRPMRNLSDDRLVALAGAHWPRVLARLRRS